MVTNLAGDIIYGGNEANSDAYLELAETLGFTVAGGKVDAEPSAVQRAVDAHHRADLNG